MMHILQTLMVNGVQYDQVESNCTRLLAHDQLDQRFYSHPKL